MAEAYAPLTGGPSRTAGWSIMVYAPERDDATRSDTPAAYVWEGEARNAADALRLAYLDRRIEQRDDEQPGGDFPPRHRPPGTVRTAEPPRGHR